MTAAPPNHVVAIDGPAAAGKSTVAQALAHQLDALLFDTGSLYRAATLAALRHGVAPTDATAIARLVSSSNLDVRPPTVDDGRLYDVILDGSDVTWNIRGPEVNAEVSMVSAHPEVRNALLDVQRRIARQGRVVMVGRDIGTVVVPDASVKIFLVASPEERARRRHQEQIERGQQSSYQQVLSELELRDRLDSERDVAPLRPASDAIIVSTDGLSVEEVVARLNDLVSRAWAQPARR